MNFYIKRSIKFLLFSHGFVDNELGRQPLVIKMKKKNANSKEII